MADNTGDNKRTKVGTRARASRGLRGTYVPKGTRTVTRDQYYVEQHRRCECDEWRDGEWTQCERTDTAATPAGFMCDEHIIDCWRPTQTTPQPRRRKTTAGAR